MVFIRPVDEIKDIFCDIFSFHYRCGYWTIEFMPVRVFVQKLYDCLSNLRSMRTLSFYKLILYYAI